jgi:hypothetical protein
MNVATLIEYSAQVVAARTAKAPLLLRFNEGSAEEFPQNGILPECLLDFNTIADCMKEAGKDIMGMIPLQVNILKILLVRKWSFLKLFHFIFL